ncbi:MAG: type IV pilus modification protein PilV [Thiothrix litoralis]|jgi:type IV pilus assembly protein PilV|uniref:type IV pilus modification protein PilV n=1 Tax=Thiothrix litoralis TaxID=2891210 RepID=UPI003C748B91
MKIPNQHFQHGVGLIEILVTVVILSVGLLGIASMQTHGLKNNNSALEHSVAVIQSYSIAEAMRVTRTAALEGEFNLGLDEEIATNGIRNLNNASVDNHQTHPFAQASLNDWRSSLRALLGDSATGSVACSGPKCTIIVQWDDGRATAGKDVQNIQVEIYL